MLALKFFFELSEPLARLGVTSKGKFRRRKTRGLGRGVSQRIPVAVLFQEGTNSNLQR